MKLFSVIILIIIILSAREFPDAKINRSGTSRSMESQKTEEKNIVPVKDKSSGSRKSKDAQSTDEKESSNAKDDDEGDDKDSAVVKIKDEKNDGGPEQDEKKTLYIEETLEYGLHGDRVEALSKIKSVQSEVFKKRIYDKLIRIIGSDDDSDFRTKVIYIIADQNLPEAVPSLIKALDSEDENTVIAAAYALKKLNGVSAKEKISALLKAQDMTKGSNKTDAFIQALGEFKAKEMAPFATDAIKNTKTSKILRESLVLFLGNIESAESRQLLLDLFINQDEDITIRGFAVNSLSKIGIKDTSKEISKVINEIESYPMKKRVKYYNLYIYSITALAKTGDGTVMPKLIESLKNNSAQIRIKAIRLIREMKDKRTIDILKYKMKYDPSMKVRKEAEIAVKELEDDGEKDKKTDEKVQGDGKDKKIEEKLQKDGKDKKIDPRIQDTAVKDKNGSGTSDKKPAPK